MARGYDIVRALNRLLIDWVLGMGHFGIGVVGVGRNSHFGIGVIGVGGNSHEFQGPLEMGHFRRRCNWRRGVGGNSHEFRRTLES
jgi:hypothetical protein